MCGAMSPRSFGAPGRGAGGCGEPGLLDGLPPCLEAQALQEARLVEALGETRDVLRRGGRPAVAGLHDLVDLRDRALAVEERDDVEGRNGQEDDLLGESSRISQAEEPLTVLLDRKRLQSPQTRAVRAGHALPALGFQVLESC